MPVPSQGHYGFHSFPGVDWFYLFIYLWVLTFPLEDCSEFGNFVITLIENDKGASPSGPPEHTPCFWGIRVIQTLCFVEHCFSLFPFHVAIELCFAINDCPMIFWLPLRYSLRFVYDCPFVIFNKGNNKITELRTIFQRESDKHIRGYLWNIYSVVVY
jgi:hypothetical protein